ncbi:MAG TPA: PTS sugar transporter [Thermodesulfatator atlanticus]|uniref:PTS sugar transporter n=1 Tax=Thermodesulfatator atlanticus TaxID=501497 RepID=A0A7V5U208_9BACT|nr:PTS sugar transporter [Thermodesulfatator atlanticus]
MTGIIIAGHGRLPEELLTVCAFILGKTEGIQSLSIDPATPAQEIRASFVKAIEEVDQGQGVLILTDLFGGTPSNMALSFLREGYVEVVSGVNLAMIIKAIQNRDKPPKELAPLVVEAGRKAITQASNLLE